MVGKIVLVDGNEIRMKQDMEFPIIAIRRDDPRDYDTRVYIPQGEIWVDYLYEDEIEDLIIWEDLVEERGPESYHTKRAEATKAKEKARLEAGISLKDLEVSREQVGEISLVYVNGRMVRKYFDPDFVGGGHHYVYSHIPVNEVWIDRAIVTEEVPFVWLHESHERELMKNGTNYDDSHTSAMAVEMIARRAKGAVYPGDAKYNNHIPLEKLREKFIYHK